MSKSRFIFFYCLFISFSSGAAPLNYPSIDLGEQKFVLSNGLTVIIAEDHKAPLVAVNVTYRVGSKNEPVGKRGFAHLFEHLLFQGSEHFDSDYFKALQKLGATSYSGTTHFDRTNYFQTVPTHAFNSILWLESDRMGHFVGAFTQAKLDEQRKVVLNEMAERGKKPYIGILQQHLQGALYPTGHPYSWSPIGTQKELEAATIDDVKQWFKDYYGPNNAILTIVGDIDTQSALQKAKQYFGDIPASKKPFENRTWVAKQHENKRDVAYDHVPLPRIYKIWNIPGFRSPELDTFDFLSQILSSDKNALLYKQLVYQERLASDVHASLTPMQLGSTFFIAATARNGVSLAKLEQRIDEIVAGLAKKTLSKNIFIPIKNNEYKRYLLGLEKVSHKANFLARYELQTNDPGTYKQSFARFIRITPKDIQHLVQKWLLDGSYALEIHPLPTYQTEPTSIARDMLPLPKGISKVSFPNIETMQLAPGITLKHIQRTSIPDFRAHILFEGGSSLDRPSKHGEMSMMMDLLNEGTKRYTGLALDQKLSSLASTIAPYSEQNFHGIYVQALDNQIKPTLALLNQVIMHPTFDQGEFDRIKKQTQEYLHKRKANPSNIAAQIYQQKIWGNNHPYGHSSYGNAESIAQIKLEDLHWAYQHNLRQQNIHIFSTGTADIEDVAKSLRHTFAQWKPRQGDVAKKPVKAAKASPHIYLVHKPGASQSFIHAGYMVPRKTPTFGIQTKLIYDMLSLKFTSRINMNIREDKGWSYGIRGSLSAFDKQSVFGLHGSVQIDKTAEALSEIAGEIHNIIGNNPISQTEMETYIKQTLLSMSGSTETNAQVLGLAIDQYRAGYSDDFIQSIAPTLTQTTLQDLRKVAKQVIHPEQLTWVIVGDLEKIEAPLRKLKLAPVVTLDPDGRPKAQ